MVRQGFQRSCLWLVIAAIVMVTGCHQQPTTQASNKQFLGAVATPDDFSASVAQRVLSEGGNAVDAAVAVAFALAVTYPEAGNIGGGGFMMIHHQGESYFLDYREVAPSLATRNMYLDTSGELVKNLSLIGHKASGVPGTVAGLWHAHKRFGSKPWRDLLQPAIGLARSHRASAFLKARIREEMEEATGTRTNFGDYFGAALPSKSFEQTELAATLTRIARDGPKDFYHGETAALIVAEMERGDGLISATDLANYKPIWREPMTAKWRDYEIVVPGLPSSGGFALIQLLKMRDYLSPAFVGLDHNSSQYVHLIAEMEKRVFADRAEYLGDPDFVDAPTQRLIADNYIQKRADEVRVNEISTLDSVRPGVEGHSTTHFSIVDGAGTAVSNTYTLNTWFGSKVVVEGAGFLLNNEMDDFSAKPGSRNFYGVVGGDANAIEPGKRMLSSMTPTILLHDNEPVFVVGSPGGSTIFTSVFQAILNVFDYNMTAQEAVAAGRFHHQLLPPTEITMSVCCPLSDDVQRALRDRGYDPKPHPWEFGDLQLLRKTADGSWQGGSDIRGRGVNRVVTH